MKKLLLFLMLFVSRETFAQLTPTHLYKAGVQGRTGYTLSAIGAFVIVAPTLSKDIDIGVKTPMAVLGTALIFTGFCFEMSAWSHVKKAGTRFALKTTNDGLTLAYKF